MREESTEDGPAELHGELDMLQRLDQFFDRAQYCAAVGYGQATGH
jgi:hypothetical protein